MFLIEFLPNSKTVLANIKLGVRPTHHLAGAAHALYQELANFFEK